MCTTAPPVHIAITGIEKVSRKLEHVPPLLFAADPLGHRPEHLDLLQHDLRPAPPGEKDGPTRSASGAARQRPHQAYADEQLRKTLQCIRCGACMNHCPVYTRIGGHAYGTTYPGPIGKIISPHMLGLEATATGHGLVAVRRLRRGLPGEDSDSRIADASARRVFSAPHANPAMRGQGAGL
jgi:L-lactate dehydrogenase complex protein LldF